MKILFCHGYQKDHTARGPDRDYGHEVLTRLREVGHEVAAPPLPNDSFAESVRRVREADTRLGPFDAVVGSSRGGAVAIAASLEAPLIL